MCSCNIFSFLLKHFSNCASFCLAIVKRSMQSNIWWFMTITFIFLNACFISAQTRNWFMHTNDNEEREPMMTCISKLLSKNIKREQNNIWLIYFWIFRFPLQQRIIERNIVKGCTIQWIQKCIPIIKWQDLLRTKCCLFDSLTHAYLLYSPSVGHKISIKTNKMSNIFFLYYSIFDIFNEQS